MKKLLIITALTLTVIIGGVVWYVQSTSTNHQNAVIARSETTKQFRSNSTATTTPFTTSTGTNAQNHNTTTDTAIRYNADGSIDTSNWQEYCNQEYGFCVKYPDGWVAVSRADVDASLTFGEYQGIQYFIDNTAPKRIGRGYVAIFLEEFKENMDIKSLTYFMANHDHIEDDHFYQIKKIDSRKVLLSPITMGNGLSVMFLHNPHTLVEIDIGGDDDDIINHIFRTIRFK